MDLKTKGSLIAAAVAGLFIGGAALNSGVSPVLAADTGYCVTKSACAGKGECGCKKGDTHCSGENSCGGKNSCKGKGWNYMKKDGKKMEMTKEDCEKNKDATFMKKS